MSTPHWTGSKLHHPDFDDHYGIDDGGFAEALHVFVDAARLAARFARGGSFQVGDLGLGSGRNLLTVWSVFDAVAPPDARLVLHTFERDPLSFADARAALARCWTRTDPSMKPRLTGLLDRMDRLRTTWPTPLPGVSVLHTGDERVRIVAWIGDALRSRRYAKMDSDVELTSPRGRDTPAAVSDSGSVDSTPCCRQTWSIGCSTASPTRWSRSRWCCPWAAARAAHAAAAETAGVARAAMAGRAVGRTGLYPCS